MWRGDTLAERFAWIVNADLTGATVKLELSGMTTPIVMSNPSGLSVTPNSPEANQSKVTMRNLTSLEQDSIVGSEAGHALYTLSVTYSTGQIRTHFYGRFELVESVDFEPTEGDLEGQTIGLPGTPGAPGALFDGYKDYGAGSVQQTLQQLIDRKADLGWILFADTEFTQASPLVVNSTPLELPNNALTQINSFAPSDADDWWNPTTKRFQPQAVGETYLIRVGLKCVPSVAERRLFFDLDVGATNPVWGDQRELSKGAGVVQAMNFTIPTYVSSVFFNNGGKFLLSSDGPVNVYGITFFITRLHQ